MRAMTRLGAAAAAALAVPAFGGASAGAFGGRPFGGQPGGPGQQGGQFGRPAGVVFVQTDNTSGNQIVAYDRAADGTLTQAGVYATGGLGGQLVGSVVDHLASQGSLAFDRDNDELYAVNA